ncbi:MAG: YihY/virulence factor BrkB family protein [Chloroflexota bacterium]|nr:YihY/virulence factor BrkB family protein [Chloroflexota bacterium]
MNVPPRLRAAAERALGWGPVATARRVMEVYDDAGGGLLAGGLTYSALFALLPSLLLLTGILGFLVDDPDRRRAIVEGIGRSLPPLSGFLQESLQQITEGAAGAGLIGLVGLAWGASRFYGSLDDAVARLFRRAPKRGFVARTLRGILSVVLLVTVFLGSLILTGIASYLADQTAARLGTESRVFWQFVTPVLTGIVFVIAAVLIYRLVPAIHVPWSTALLPALLVGTALAALTQLFSYLAPRLIGAAAVYGTFVAIFAAMIWLATGFQLLLMGAAWVSVRLGPPPPAQPFVDEA